MDKKANTIINEYIVRDNSVSKVAHPIISKYVIHDDGGSGGNEPDYEAMNGHQFLELYKAPRWTNWGDDWGGAMGPVNSSIYITAKIAMCGYNWTSVPNTPYSFFKDRIYLSMYFLTAVFYNSNHEFISPNSYNPEAGDYYLTSWDAEGEEYMGAEQEVVDIEIPYNSTFLKEYDISATYTVPENVQNFVSQKQSEGKYYIGVYVAARFMVNANITGRGWFWLDGYLVELTDITGRTSTYSWGIRYDPTAEPMYEDEDVPFPTDWYAYDPSEHAWTAPISGRYRTLDLYQNRVIPSGFQ